MFSWSNGGNRRRASSATTSSSSNYPGARNSTANNSSSLSPPRAHAIRGSIRPPVYTRQQHLDSYLNDATLKPSTRRVSSDDSIYDTVFQTTTGNALILRVRLPPVAGLATQTRAPEMTLVGVRAIHQWLDTRMCVIGYEPITSDSNWQTAGHLLSTAVNAVVYELQVHPPRILEITDEGLLRIQQSLGNNNTSQQQTSAPPDYQSVIMKPRRNNMPEIRLPDVSSSDSKQQLETALENKNRDSLQTMLDDELEFLSVLHTVPIYKEMVTKGSCILQENEEIATATIAKQEHLQLLHKDVTTLKSTLDQKIKHFYQLQKQQLDLCAPPDTRHVYKLLTMAKKQPLEESETLATTWMDDDDEKNDNVDDFCEQFLVLRQVHHVRAAKLERLKANNTG